MNAPRGQTPWLLKELPSMYLAYCRAASQLQDGAQIARDHIAACRRDPTAAAPEPNRDTVKKDLKRALALANLIAAAGWTWLLDSLESALEGDRVERVWDAVSVIEETTDRWERWGREGARDLVLLVKGTDKVVSLSSGEVEEQGGPTESALATYRLENVHYYPAFNRMRPVTGRRVNIRVVADEKSYRNAAASFKPLLRTVRDARRIGESRGLREFTPVGRPDGVKLWSFSALLGRIGAPRPIPAPAAGFRPEHTVPFTDRTGRVDLVFHPEVFNRCVRDFSAFNFTSPVQYFEDLSTWEGPSLVVVGWPFGSAHLVGPLEGPTVVHWFPLPPDAKTASYEPLTRLVSARKIRTDVLETEYPDWRGLLTRPDVIEVGQWAYYVPAGCDPRLFRMYVERGFQGVDYMVARARIPIEREQWMEFVRGYQRFFTCSPADKRIYISDEPDEEADATYPRLEINRSPASRLDGPREPGRTGEATIAVDQVEDRTPPFLQHDQILVHSAVLTRRGEEFVRVVSHEKQQTPTGKIRIKVVETFDPRTGMLTRTKEVWPAGGPESSRLTTVLSRTKARVEASGQ